MKVSCYARESTQRCGQVASGMNFVIRELKISLPLPNLWGD